DDDVEVALQVRALFVELHAVAKVHLRRRGCRVLSTRRPAHEVSATRNEAGATHRDGHEHVVFVVVATVVVVDDRSDRVRRARLTPGYGTGRNPALAKRTLRIP